MSRFPSEYGDNNRFPARGGSCYHFPPYGYDAYPQHFNTPTFGLGLFTCLAKASIADGQYVTVRLNTNQLGVPSSRFALGGPSRTVFFEFDTVPDGVTPGRVAVDISADVTATDVRDRLLIAMAATFNGTPIKVNAVGADQISVTSVIRWADLTLAEYVANPGFTVTPTVRAPVIRPVICGAGPMRGWHRFDLKAAQAAELPIQIGELAY